MCVKLVFAREYVPTISTGGRGWRRAFHRLGPMFFIVVAYLFVATQEFFVTLLTLKCMPLQYMLSNVFSRQAAIVTNIALVLQIVCSVLHIHMCLQILFTEDIFFLQLCRFYQLASGLQPFLACV